MCVGLPAGLLASWLQVASFVPPPLASFFTQSCSVEEHASTCVHVGNSESPSDAYPTEHLHVRVSVPASVHDTTPFVPHALLRQSSMSVHLVLPVPLKPAGHAVHVKSVDGALRSVHLVSESHGAEAQAFVSSHWVRPPPTATGGLLYPVGQALHV